jgi:hypothetical protein
MDPAPIILGILAINLAVFLAGCALAVYRTWREGHPAHRRPIGSSPSLGRPSHQSPR